MKWYKTYYFLIPLIIVVGFLNFHPELFFKPTGYHHWGWQCAILASIGFITLIRIRDKNNWKNLLGINFKIRDLYIFLSLTFILTFFSYWIISYILGSNNNIFKVLLFDYNQFENFKGAPFHVILSGYLYYIPQVFNEEMIVGALLLNSLKNRFKSINDLSISAIVALVFCLMHLVLYRFRPIQAQELLSFVTLISLFLVGLIRNQLILRTGKITYSWAIHLSWNFMFFQNFMIQSNGENASEPRRFNLIFGDFRVMIMIFIITFFVIFWPKLRRIKMINKPSAQ